MMSRPESVEQVQEIVREAIRAQQSLDPVGGGTQLHVGYAQAAMEHQISLRALQGIVEYTPEDLVVVAQAGMNVAILQAILAEHGQTLPLEVALSETQTVGGIVATRAVSLTRASSGSVRDWLIGCNAVCGDGQLIVGGGRVVKNVAGYDLPKLFCGSWGTLGIITQVAFKVAPRPVRSQVLLVTLNAGRNSEEALDALHHRLSPAFSFVLNPAAAQVLLGDDVPPAQFLVLGFEGQPEAVESLAAQAKDVLTPHAFQILDLPDAVGTKLRSLLRDLPLRDAPMAARFQILPSQVGAFGRMLEWTARRAGFDAVVFGDAGAGTVWAQMSPRDWDDSDGDPGTSPAWAKLYPDFRDKADRVGGSCVIERMPQAWREMDVPVWSPMLADVQWMRALKEQFDPHKIFRPGRFVDRI